MSLSSFASATTTTMRAVQGRDYGPINTMLSVQDGVKIPRLEDLSPKERKNIIVIQTLAVALAPGDCRVLSGKTRELQGPPSFPYVPGGDCCGIVVQIPEDKGGMDIPFQVGDRVAARFFEKPSGALGEYAFINAAVCDKVPANISSNEAAALASACPSIEIADYIQKGERVLVLGAGGGIGSHVCQLLRARGASYVVGVSKDPQRLLKGPISCDEAFDYTKEDVFSLEKFKTDPFDVIIDLASGFWLRLTEDEQKKTKNPIVKSFSQGGRYITTSPDVPTFELHSMWQVFHFFVVPSVWRAIRSRLWKRWTLPGYTFAMALPDNRKVMTRTMEAAKSGVLKAVTDPMCPFPFTTEGVRKAFSLLESRHAKGKVVIQVATEDNGTQK